MKEIKVPHTGAAEIAATTATGKSKPNSIKRGSDLRSGK